MNSNKSNHMHEINKNKVNAQINDEIEIVGNHNLNLFLVNLDKNYNISGAQQTRFN